MSNPATNNPVPDPDPGLLARITRRCAGASAKRPKTVVALWLLFVFGLFAAGGMAGTQTLSGSDENVGESARADSRLEAANLNDPAVENLMVSTGSAAKTRTATRDLVRNLEAKTSSADVKRVTDPLNSPSGLTDGGRKALVQATLRGDPENAVDHVDTVDAAIAKTEARNPGATVNAVGPGTLDKAVDKIVGEDLHHAEMISLPITLIILLLAFGAFVAASVPLVLGMTSVMAALGGMALISQGYPMGDASSTMVVLLGLAVGVDYSLFYIRREKEERMAGRSAEASLNAASSTVGRDIVISGFTVIIGLGGLAITGMSAFTSMAIATMLVVAIAVIGSLTVLPAVLALLGDRINRGRLPVIGRLQARRERRRSVTVIGSDANGESVLRKPADDRGFWAGLAKVVTKRPGISLLVATCLLGSIAVPALGMKSGDNEYSLPKDDPIMVAHSKIEASFPGAPATADLVVSGTSLNSDDSGKALRQICAEGRRITGGKGPMEVRVSRTGDTALVRIPSPDAGPAQTKQAINDLRDELPGFARNVLPGADLQVTGDSAESLDADNQISARTPVVVAAVLLLAMALLLLTFRSLPLAISVVGLNLLSMAATWGVLTAVFQNTWAEGLLDFTSSGMITNWVPLTAFVILFGLSMDYTILVLERIREARGDGMSPRDAARKGVASTAGAVTSAAAVMVAVFAIFPTLPLAEMKMIGVALSVGILIDATIVRGIALPAMVALLGERGVKAPKAGSRSRHSRTAKGSRDERRQPASRPELAGRPAEASFAWGRDAN